MLQAVKATLRCSQCGCIALPDATKCPKCGALYHKDKEEVLFDTFRLTSIAPEPVRTAKDTTECLKVVQVNYELDCPRHGRVRIKATVISAPMRCPFC